jgi:hypothetical protein
VPGGSSFSMTNNADSPGRSPMAASSSFGSEIWPCDDSGRGPWGIAINSKGFFTIRLMAPAQPAPGLFSVGYGGRRKGTFLDLLVSHGVEILLDVRLHAVSGIPGFSGGSLRRTLASVGIEYRHVAILGNPRDNRAPFQEGAIANGRKRFKRLLANSAARKSLEELADEALQRRVAVLCAERDHERCHRQVIIEEAQNLRPGLSVTVLA